MLTSDILCWPKKHIRSTRTERARTAPNVVLAECSDDPFEKSDGIRRSFVESWPADGDACYTLRKSSSGTVDAGRAPEPSLVRAAAGPVRFIPAPAVEAVPDDLTRIVGIVPRISGILAEAGITTFAQLATTSISNPRRILANAGVRARVDSWPEEARLAAGG